MRRMVSRTAMPQPLCDELASVRCPTPPSGLLAPAIASCRGAFNIVLPFIPEQPVKLVDGIPTLQMPRWGSLEQSGFELSSPSSKALSFCVMTPLPEGHCLSPHSSAETSSSPGVLLFRRQAFLVSSSTASLPTFMSHVPRVWPAPVGLGCMPSPCQPHPAPRALWLGRPLSPSYLPLLPASSSWDPHFKATFQ